LSQTTGKEAGRILCVGNTLPNIRPGQIQHPQFTQCLCNRFDAAIVGSVFFCVQSKPLQFRQGVRQVQTVRVDNIGLYASIGQGSKKMKSGRMMLH